MIYLVAKPEHKFSRDDAHILHARIKKICQMGSNTVNVFFLFFFFFMRGSRIFFRGGPWSRPDGQKTVWTSFFVLLFLRLFCYCFFLVLNLFYLQFTEGVQWFYYRESYTFSRIQRDSNIFQGGGGGSKC